MYRDAYHKNIYLLFLYCWLLQRDLSGSIRTVTELLSFHNLSDSLFCVPLNFDGGTFCHLLCACFSEFLRRSSI